MRIAIINLTSGGISGGYKTYLNNILPRLAAHEEIEEVLCASPASLKIDEGLLLLAKTRFIDCRPFRFMRHDVDRILQDAIRTFSPDVIFIPVERYCSFSGIPLVVMLQNMGPLLPVTGNPLSEQLRYVAQRFETRIAIQRADHIIVPTNFVREFLIKQWHIPKDHSTTIHYGSPSSTPSTQRPESIPEDWDGRFLFTAGSIEPYRGLEDIIDAMEFLPPSATFVVAGEARWNMIRYRGRLLRRMKRCHLAHRIRWVGHLSSEEMAWCYRSCVAFVMTSRVESFGMAGLEAMVYGCACIVADNPPFPEIFDAAALYYPPKDSNALAATIMDVAHWNDAKRLAMSVRAKERAAQFSWDANVNQLVDVLQKTIDDRAHHAL